MLFQAFVVKTFQNQPDPRLKKVGLSRDDAECLRFGLNANPITPNSYRRRYSKGLAITDSIWSSGIVNLLIVVNVIILLMGYEGSSDEYKKRLEIANVVLAGCFVFEAVIKIVVLTPHGYFKDRWNTFDFIITLVGLVDIIFVFSNALVPVSALRLSRVLRLVKTMEHKELDSMLNILSKTVIRMTQLIVLMLMVLFIFSILGMMLFAEIPIDETTSINRNNHFHNFPATSMLLFRTMSGENWQEMLRDTYTAGPTKCGDDMEAEWCGSRTNFLYFNLFIYITDLILMNILLAVIVDTFDYMYACPSILQAQHLPAFISAWAKKDPEGNGTLHISDVIEVMKELPPPLGVGSHCSDTQLYKFMTQLPVPIDKETYHVDFRPFFMAIIRVKLNIWMYALPDESALIDAVEFVSPGTKRSRIEAAFPRMNHSMRRFDEVTGPTVQFLYTVICLQRRTRRNKHRRRISAASSSLSRQLKGLSQPLIGMKDADVFADMDLYASALTECESVLQVARAPMERMAMLLMKAYVSHIEMVLDSDGRVSSLQAEWYYLFLTGYAHSDEHGQYERVIGASHLGASHSAFATRREQSLRKPSTQPKQRPSTFNARKESLRKASTKRVSKVFAEGHGSLLGNPKRESIVGAQRDLLSTRFSTLQLD